MEVRSEGTRYGVEVRSEGTRYGFEGVFKVR